MALTPQGYVPLDAFEQNQEMQQQNMQAQAEARAAAQANGGAEQSSNNGRNGKKPSSDGAPAGAAEKPKPKGKKPAKKTLGKAVRHEPIPFSRPIVAHAEAELRIRIHHILQKTAVSVTQQLSKKHFKLRKDDDDDLEWAAAASATADSLDLSSLEALVDATPAYLSRIAADSGKQTLATLGVFDDGDLVNQVNADSLAFARTRAAEMVGKKWVDGELVDNPNADWVISDATRDELRGIIGQVYSGELSPTDLEGAIKQAGAFSDDRAALIARTELQNANAQGTLDGMRTAGKAGVKVLKEWQADDEACDICLDNEDDGPIQLDDEFSSGADAPPEHPNCECVLVPVTGDEADDDADADEE
jgi:Phage Mu protein F like protein